MLGKRLKEIIAERGCSISEVYRRTGVSRALISGVLSGKHKRVSSETLEKLASGLGISVQELLQGELTGEDEEYIAVVRELQDQGVTRERLAEFAQWLKKIKTPGT